jgi:plasmid maintenance system antidote protein VapI
VNERPVAYIRWSGADWFKGKISRRPAVEQALFINLQALMMHAGGPIAMTREDVLDMADRLRVEADDVEQGLSNLSERGIIVSDAGVYSIKFLEVQFGKIRDTSESRREAAKRRWKAATANAPDTDANASDNGASVPDPMHLLNTAADPDALAMQEKEKEKENSNCVQKKAEVLTLWNTIAEEFVRPRLRKVTDRMMVHLRQRLKNEPEFWVMLERSMSDLGEMARTGRWLTFDWIVKSESNMEKLFNGNYSDERPGAAIPPRPADIPQEAYDNIVNAAAGNLDAFNMSIRIYRAQHGGG